MRDSGNKRVLVAMSGGVDSSLAAALLKDAGAEVIGVFMHVWDYSRQATPGSAACCAAEDAHDARRVANVLGISFYTLDMRDAFRRDVINPFIDEYESGRTPNPCANCNQFVKFGALLETAKRLECEYVATGHYVQRRDVASDVRLFRGADRAKDQSYFLATISRDQARHILFPVGHLNKAETRRLSAAYGLPTASKHESQDICFIPAGDRVAFLRREGSSAGFRAGEIVDRSGRVVGHHDGIAHFTIGQRKGLGLSDGPWNVVALDSHAARVVVDRPSSALIGGVYVQDVRWIRRPDDGSVVSIKTRYRSPSIPCRLEIRADGIVSVFERPQPPTAPGQVAAFYDGDELLGGGIIHDLL